MNGIALSGMGGSGNFAKRSPCTHIVNEGPASVKGTGAKIGDGGVAGPCYTCLELWEE